ncbi:hypothetical protein KL905_002966 [Ogataea polymorpha]|nr:hypothetical protein KL937_002524 [Ogataea polymorpha]KAG7893387.1 hypothetical protein KL908_003120 [Ogataea polymorpha]KAG7900824.1 hypothetical protein KL935_002757 [Ogataea polymorpha]KAG7908018.1 hypothetical protein KL906_003435 [Ogataea polymorpha]KAG7916601.1 hypothetical protein KL927_003240 [Ogataea polymorpha]
MPAKEGDSQLKTSPNPYLYAAELWPAGGQPGYQVLFQGVQPVRVKQATAYSLPLQKQNVDKTAAVDRRLTERRDVRQPYRRRERPRSVHPADVVCVVRAAVGRLQRDQRHFPSTASGLRHNKNAGILFDGYLSDQDLVLRAGSEPEKQKALGSCKLQWLQIHLNSGADAHKEPRQLENPHLHRVPGQHLLARLLPDEISQIRRFAERARRKQPVVGSETDPYPVPICVLVCGAGDHGLGDGLSLLPQHRRHAGFYPAGQGKSP